MEFVHTDNPRAGSVEIDTLSQTERDAMPLWADYRTLPITQGFDWARIIAGLAESRQFTPEKLYLVVFRSVRQPDADEELITQLDDAAHEEAKQSDALLHYYADSTDEDGRALSWCLWTSEQAARDALSGPAHKEAVRNVRAFYDPWDIELYDIYPFGEEIVFDPVYKHG